LWQSEKEIVALPRERTRFEPRLSSSEREKLYAGWRQAVKRALLDPRDRIQ